MNASPKSKLTLNILITISALLGALFYLLGAGKLYANQNISPFLLFLSTLTFFLSFYIEKVFLHAKAFPWWQILLYILIISSLTLRPLFAT